MPLTLVAVFGVLCRYRQPCERGGCRRIAGGGRLARSRIEHALGTHRVNRMSARFAICALAAEPNERGFADFILQYAADRWVADATHAEPPIGAGSTSLRVKPLRTSATMS